MGLKSIYELLYLFCTFLFQSAAVRADDFQIPNHRQYSLVVGNQPTNHQTNQNMRKLTSLILTIVFVFPVFGQDIVTDSKGNFIFGMPATTIQPTLSSNNVGISTPIKYFSRKMYYIVDSTSKDTVNTMSKSHILFAKANIVNNTKSTLIFNSKTNYSPSFEFGIAWGFDTLYHPSEKAGFYFTYSASVFGEYQNFNYYDTISQSFAASKTNRISPGIKGNITAFKGTTFAISASMSYQNSIVTDNLTSYQKRPNTFYFDPNISTNGQNDGYLSPVNPTENLRLSLSLPQFWLSGKWNTKVPFVITPYYHGLISKKNIPNNNFGVVLSILPKPFRKFDRDNSTYKKDAIFKFAQAFNLGYNFISTGNKDPKFFFVSGTFNLGVFKPKKDIPRDKNSLETQHQ